MCHVHEHVHVVYVNIRTHLYMYTVGVFTGDQNPSDQSHFVVERATFSDLCQGIMEPCAYYRFFCSGTPYITLC